MNDISFLNRKKCPDCFAYYDPDHVCQHVCDGLMKFLVSEYKNRQEASNDTELDINNNKL